LYLAIILCLVIIVTATFEHFQDAKASRVMDKFKNMIPQFAIVIREGKRDEIEATKLVVGDLVELSIGNKVPADVRIIDSSNLKVFFLSSLISHLSSLISHLSSHFINLTLQKTKG